MFYRLQDERKEKELKTAFKDSRGRPYVVLCKDPQKLNVNSFNYIEDMVRKRVFRTERDTVRLSFKLLDIPQADREARDELEFHKNYIGCIKLLSGELVDDDVRFDPKNEKLTNTAIFKYVYHLYSNAFRPRVSNLLRSTNRKTLQRKRVLV